MKFLKLKKAVMFGLDARIKKLCHAGLDPVSHALNNKHAAMFGLDARIALAIFGALSVISGAALYSAIQSANVVKWQVYFNELTKATEAYYLDNGKKLPVTNPGSSFISATDLLVNRENLATWNGPYWQGIENSSLVIDNMTSTLGSSFSILLFANSTWSVGYGDACVVDDINCAQWIRISTSGNDNRAKTRTIFKLLDEKIDNNDGALAGSVRSYDAGLGTSIYYKSNQYTKRS
jgi:type II secretory pathway pseudopilin PulG